jgi:hypothetical protein
MKIEWGNYKLTKLSKWLLLALLVVIIASAAYCYFFIYKKTSTPGPQNSDKKYSLSLYTYIQNDKAHISAYDPITSKHYDILTIDWKDKDGYYGFNASYSSARDQIVFNTMSGLSVYDLKTKEQKELVKNYKGAKDIDVSNYRSPVWSNNSKKIVYFKAGYEGGNYGMMDPDGSNAKDIEGEGGYNFIWKPDSTEYAIGSSGGMATGPGINVSLADPITKTKQILSTKELRDVDSLVWLDKIYFSGTKQNVNAGDNNLYQILSVNADGTDVKVIDKDEYNNQNLISDGDETLYYTKYLAKSVDNQRKSAGVHMIKKDGTGKEPVYQDGDKQIFVQAVDSDYLAMKSSTNDWSNEAIKTLVLYDKTTKKASMVGEGTRIEFFDWIKSNKLPSELVEATAPKPTEAELKAYSDSMKSHGYLSRTYYDYCWDYDCQSATYPYAKKAKSETPEIISLSEKPQLLTGKVTIPVIYFYTDTPLTDEHMNILNNDATALDSFARVSKWINEQGKAAGKTLEFSFDLKGQSAIDAGCVTYSGTDKTFDTKCISDTVSKLYPGLANAPVVITVMANMNAYAASTNFEISTGKNLFLIGFSFASSIEYIKTSTYYATEEQKAAEIKKRMYDSNYMGWDYRIKNLLALFGAKDKNATYKTPAKSDSPGCFVGNSDSVMCDRNVNSSNVVKKFNEKVIDEITWKELGWYDADGDGIMEVNDKCPFDKTNKC